jgi:hypothetical protein
MKAFGIALVIVGYALFYTGASNLFTGGQGWGFLQSLMNRGTANQSGSLPNNGGSSGGNSGGTSGGGSLLGGLGGLLGSLGDWAGKLIP